MNKRVRRIKNVCALVFGIGLLIVLGIVGGIENNTLPLVSALWCVPCFGAMGLAVAFINYIYEH